MTSTTVVKSYRIGPLMSVKFSSGHELVLRTLISYSRVSHSIYYIHHSYIILLWALLYKDSRNKSYVEMV